MWSIASAHGSNRIRTAEWLRRAALRLAVATAFLLTAAVFAPAALATTWHVDDDAAADPMTCDSSLTYKSLSRLAYTDGCALDGDTIEIAAGTYPLFINVNLYRDVVVRGAGAAQTVFTTDAVTGAVRARPGAAVVLRDVSFTGDAWIGNEGDLTLRSVVIRDFDRQAANSPLSSWGTSENPATLTILDSAIVGNRAFTGALHNGSFSTATLVNTTVAQNSGVSTGGISNHDGGLLRLVNSTVAGNAAIGYVAPIEFDITPRGGGIANWSWAADSVLLRNSVVAGNSAAVGPDCYGRIADGAGGHNLVGSLRECGLGERQTIGSSGEPTGGTFTLTFKGATTVPLPFDASATQIVAALEALQPVGTGNVVAMPGVNEPLPATSVTIEFVGDLGASDQPQLVAAHTLTGGTSPSMWTSTWPDGRTPEIAAGVNGDLVGVAPLLGPLGANGGPTPTRAPLPGSPLIGAGDASTCQTGAVGDLDARGRKRWSALRGCDIGAHDTGGFGGRTSGTTTCSSAASPRMSVSPPAVKAGPPGLQFVVWRTVFAHFDGVAWAVEPAAWVISVATPDVATTHHWSTTGTYLGDSTAVRQTSQASGAVISIAWHELVGLGATVTGFEPALLTTASGPSSAAGFFCLWTAGVPTAPYRAEPDSRIAPRAQAQPSATPRFAISKRLARSLAARAERMAAVVAAPSRRAASSARRVRAVSTARSFLHGSLTNGKEQR